MGGCAFVCSLIVLQYRHKFQLTICSTCPHWHRLLPTPLAIWQCTCNVWARYTVDWQLRHGLVSVHRICFVYSRSRIFTPKSKTTDLKGKSDFPQWMNNPHGLQHVYHNEWRRKALFSFERYYFRCAVSKILGAVSYSLSWRAQSQIFSRKILPVPSAVLQCSFMRNSSMSSITLTGSIPPMPGTSYRSHSRFACLSGHKG